MVSSRALGTLAERKWNAPSNLPVQEDVQRVSGVLEDELKKASAQLQEAPTIQSYVNLARATLATVMLFNRRRPGETARLTTATFAKRSRSVNEEITEHLSKLEQELCRELTHVTVRGKRGIGVPMLLTAKMVETMELLVASRSRAGISSDNPYLFTSGVEGDAAPLRGSDCVRLFAKKAGATNISATSYRKHAATMLQLLQLSDTELDVVARFMGHDIRVHRSYYRLPERTVYAAKVSKILIAMETGMGEFAGQKLNDLDPVNMSCGDRGSDEDAALGEEAEDVEGQETETQSGQETQRGDTKRTGDTNGQETESTKRVGKKRKDSESTEAPARIYRPNQKKPVKRTGWTPEEREAVAFWMKDNIRDLKCPTMSQCVEVLKKESRLHRRSWKDLKFCTYNMIQTHKRRLLRK
ncbi:uncharacterized protein LOC122371602 [Amphibalanus amphitrite]|uniref:uncharacterized protein LOC122371602 n=1 Tax=Amphibalanus amphitrite TaxID=1232801 RepID=UPI001C901D13|nr:uncharacterized protein LOC122371602 [Amphibalanus amphitrite]